MQVSAGIAAVGDTSCCMLPPSDSTSSVCTASQHIAACTSQPASQSAALTCHEGDRGGWGGLEQAGRCALPQPPHPLVGCNVAHDLHQAAHRLGRHALRRGK